MRKSFANFGIILIAAAVFFLRGSGRPPRSYIGTLGQMGLFIEQVFEGSPAQAAGLHPGDIVLSVNSTALDSRERFRQLVALSEPGTRLDLRVFRYNAAKGGFEAHRFALTSISYPDRSDR